MKQFLWNTIGWKIMWLLGFRMKVVGDDLVLKLPIWMSRRQQQRFADEVSRGLGHLLKGGVKIDNN